VVETTIYALEILAYHDSFVKKLKHACH